MPHVNNRCPQAEPQCLLLFLLLSDTPPLVPPTPHLGLRHCLKQHTCTNPKPSLLKDSVLMQFINLEYFLCVLQLSC